MQTRQHQITRQQQAIASYDYPVEPDTYRWEPYSLRVVQEKRTNDPYQPHPQQLFVSRDVHPVFPDYADIFSQTCTRLHYCSFAVSYAADDEPSTRLLVKNFPLLHMARRGKFLAAVIFAATNIRTRVQVEDPRYSRTNPAFFDNNIFVWVPQRFVAAILALSGRVLCDADSFLVEHGDQSTWALCQYGRAVREFLSQDQRHELTRGLPTQPLVFTVSHDQR